LASVQTWHFSLFGQNWANAKRNRRQEDLNSNPFGELEETTEMQLYYTDEDYPAKPEIQ